MSNKQTVVDENLILQDALHDKCEQCNEKDKEIAYLKQTIRTMRAVIDGFHKDFIHN